MLRLCLFAFAGLALTAISSPAMAHHPSGVSGTGTSGPIVTIPAATLEQGAFSAWSAFEYIAFDELSDATLAAAALNDEHVHSLATLESPSVGLSYGVTDRLMVSLQLPYVIRTGIREGEHAHEDDAAGADHHDDDGHDHEQAMPEIIARGTSEGIGDLSLLGQYRFLGQGSGPRAALLFGVKTPTGATDERDNQGELFETELQPGSGSWDGLFGLAFSLGSGKWSLDSNLLYAAAGEGAQDTNLGDRLHYNGAVSYRLIGAGQPLPAAHEHRQGDDHRHHAEQPETGGGLAVDAALEINGEWQAEETISGESDPNSGGNVVYLSPGVRLTANAWSGFVSVGLPIVNDLNGEQSEAEYRLLGGGSLSF
ncbi:MAG: transporter [Methyloceanibacter sp.]